MITREQVEHIANLARIRVDEKELAQLQQDLSEVLDYFGILGDADTSKVVSLREIPQRGKPTTHSILLENVQREDRALPSESKLIEKLLSLFPAAKEGFLKVKEVLVKHKA